MKIGILCEGDYDIEPIKIITSKILRAELDNPQFSYKEKVAHGGIYTQMDKATLLFFETEPICDFSIFINDTDKYPKRNTQIKRWTKTYSDNNQPYTIIVECPNPTFESWFFIEENALKRVFSLDSTGDIPFSELKPKSRVKHIFDAYNNDITRSLKDSYSEISETLNIEVLSGRDTKFQKFRNEVVRVARTI